MKTKKITISWATKIMLLIFIASFTSCEDLFEDLDQEEEQSTSVCPGSKAIEYKNKAENSNPDDSAVYSYMSAIYAYKCECTNGSSRATELKSVINGMVDVYETAYNSRFGSISRVSSCKSY